jgi:hypothetical protein
VSHFASENIQPLLVAPILPIQRIIYAEFFAFGLAFPVRIIDRQEDPVAQYFTTSKDKGSTLEQYPNWVNRFGIPESAEF